MDGSVAKVDNAKETADLRDAPLIQVPKTTLLIYYNGKQLTARFNGG